MAKDDKFLIYLICGAIFGAILGVTIGLWMWDQCDFECLYAPIKGMLS